MVSVVSDLAFDAKGVAAEFVKARRSAGSFTKYPGSPPQDLDSAYRCQDEAIALWGDAIAGWKVGWIPEPLSPKFGAQRLVGPIFSRSVQRSNGTDTAERRFSPGFRGHRGGVRLAAREGRARECHRVDSRNRAALREDDVHRHRDREQPAAVNINDYGPAVVASDFGNNAGLLLGAEIPDWQTRTLDTMNCETRIDGDVVGRGNAAAVSGGPLSALAFACVVNARRGRPLRAGDFVSTGAATGVHSIAPASRPRPSLPGWQPALPDRADDTGDPPDC